MKIAKLLPDKIIIGLTKRMNYKGTQNPKICKAHSSFLILLVLADNNNRSQPQQLSYWFEQQCYRPGNYSGLSASKQRPALKDERGVTKWGLTWTIDHE